MGYLLLVPVLADVQERFTSQKHLAELSVSHGNLYCRRQSAFFLPIINVVKGSFVFSLIKL
jgi:hypothetical protein